tara:strand:- start:2322 stop:3932 length:1611 start_codon:yes stop_codon:yes gene_type:complete
MLFNSYIFIFLFLPITLLGFHLLGKNGHHRLTVSWLIAASLFFYGWWNPIYIVLIIGSTLFNYSMGSILLARPNKLFLSLGIIGNIGTLGYFKYANFFVDNINTLVSNDIILEQIILPLGISFFTFQQITYLVDTYLGKTKEYNFLKYCLFVTFFPQLIAGPIVHHKNMMPQFTDRLLSGLKLNNLASGFTIFVIGLFKKVIIADGIAVSASPLFEVAERSIDITFFEAWGGAIAYTFQLYFDFSGYSDMAIGLALMFGIIIPVNFLSPYKANNINEFWRNWHISLSNLIRDYLYYPISLSLTRYANNINAGPFSAFNLTILLPTMFAFFWVGLWHGAGWNFVLFGLLHGSYIVIYNVWVKIKYNFPKIKIVKKAIISNTLAKIITFLAITFSFVLFRAESLNGATNILSSMLGAEGISLPLSMADNFGRAATWLTENNIIVFEGMFRNNIFGHTPLVGLLWILTLFVITLFLPNTQQIMRSHNPGFEMWTGKILKTQFKWMVWHPTIYWGIFVTIMFVFCILSVSKPSEFLYFQF